ncbi:MAG: repressor LexA [SAR116 cluster bacterium]|nr:repressor LexA [SAR116 cluster bacterium]RPH12163.1 MAG: transcriptional repressor LexA [Alphaproteobacteria bacterium TMED54]
MLTIKQSQLLNFLIKKIEYNGTSPSYEEICVHLNLKSKSGIHRIVQGLLERDYIIKLNNKARSIYPKKFPNGKSYTYIDEITENDQSKNSNSTKIPILGKIAAGMPIEAIENANEYLDVPVSLLSKGKCYALHVEGESMIEAGILQNDIAIIDSEKHPINGDIIVALIDDLDVTLKRFRKNGESIALEPANKNFKTHIYGPSRIKIQGVLTSLYRNY